MVVAWRRKDGVLRVGCRLDVKCLLCEEGLVLNTNSSRLVNAGAPAICRQCFMQMHLLTELPPGDTEL